MDRSKKLIECETFFELEELLNVLSLSSSALAGKVRYYRNRSKLLELEEGSDTIMIHHKVLGWLEEYKVIYNKGYKVLDCKSLAIELLRSGCSVNNVKKEVMSVGYSISRTTIYKYKKELVDE